MKKYRIIKETKEKTKTVRFYLEKYWSFLCWNGWKRLKGYDVFTGYSYILVFDSIDKAQRHYDLMTEKTIIEEIELKL